MMRLRKAWRDQRGAAAIEFALVLPMLLALVLLGFEGWLRISEVAQMRSALQTGARYYQSGGADDTAAVALIQQAWGHAPADMSVVASRACACGGTGSACSDQCAGSTLPAAYVTLTASGSYTNLMDNVSLAESSVVRVR